MCYEGEWREIKFRELGREEGSVCEVSVNRSELKCVSELLYLGFMLGESVKDEMEVVGKWRGERKVEGVTRYIGNA